MSPEDEQELHRLAGMLEQIDQNLPSDSQLREALYKAGLSLSLLFLDGSGPDIEEQYLNRVAELSCKEREHLRSLGLDPGEE
ncbi:hypothetical protein OAS39_08470 [Pirellulales bacterium]|nr:hypothetical protein [Pirellulales bacterium]